LGAAGAYASEADPTGEISNDISTFVKAAIGLGAASVATGALHGIGKVAGDFGPTMERGLVSMAKRNSMSDRLMALRTVADRAFENGEITLKQHEDLSRIPHEFYKAEREQYNSGADKRHADMMVKWQDAPEAWANKANRIFENLDPGEIPYNDKYGSKQFKEYMSDIRSWWDDIVEKNRIAVKNGVEGVEELPATPASFRTFGAPEGTLAAPFKNAFAAIKGETHGVNAKNLQKMKDAVREWYQENSYIKDGKLHFRGNKRPKYLDNTGNFEKDIKDMKRTLHENDVNLGNYNEFIEQEAEMVPRYFVGERGAVVGDNLRDVGTSGKVLPYMGEDVHGASHGSIFRDLAQMDHAVSGASSHSAEIENVLRNLGGTKDAQMSPAYNAIRALIGTPQEHGTLLGDLYTQRGVPLKTNKSGGIVGRALEANKAMFGTAATAVLTTNPTSAVKQEFQVPLAAGAHGGSEKLGSHVKYRVKSMASGHPIIRDIAGLERQIDPNQTRYTKYKPFSENTAQQKLAVEMRATSEIQDIFNPANDARYKNYRDLMWTPEEQAVLRYATGDGTHPVDKSVSEGLEASHIVRELEASNGSELATSRPSFTKGSDFAKAFSGFIGTPLGIDMSIIANKGKYGSAPIKGSAGLAQASGYLLGQHAANLYAASSPAIKTAVLASQGSYVPAAMTGIRMYANQQSDDDPRTMAEMDKAQELERFMKSPTAAQSLTAIADAVPTKVFNPADILSGFTSSQPSVEKKISKAMGEKQVYTKGGSVADALQMVAPGIAVPANMAWRAGELIANSDYSLPGNRDVSGGIKRLASRENPIPALSQYLSFNYLDNGKPNIKAINDDMKRIDYLVENGIILPDEANRARQTLEIMKIKPKGGSR